MRGLIIIPILFLIILALSTNVKADVFNPYNTTAVSVRLFPYTSLSDPMHPKIACHPLGFHCLALIYENNTFFGRGVKVWYTTNFFKTYPLFSSLLGTVSVDYSAYVSGFYDTFHLPYDVKYTNGKYYFFVNNNVYSYEGGSTYTSLGNFQATVPGSRWCLGYYSDTQIRCLEPTTGTFNFLKGTVLTKSAYSLRGAWSAVSNLRTYINWYNGSEDTSQGFATLCTGVNTCQYDSGLSGFPTAYTGLYYFDGSKVHYDRFHNSTWQVETTDLVNFGDPEEVNPFGINTINTSDTDITENNQIWVWQRRRQTPDLSLTSGIWLANVPLTRVRVFAEGFDVGKKTTETVNISVRINCTYLNSEFVSSGSGLFVDVFTPCQTGNDIEIETFDFQPSNVLLNNFTMTTNCLGSTNYIRTDFDTGFYKSWDYRISVRDSIFGNVIDGASISLDADQGTTDKNGNVIFNIFPIGNPDMTFGDFDSTACTQFMTFTGTEQASTVIITKNGYESFSESFTIAKSPFNVETDFNNERTIFVDPLNSIITVKLFSKDGIEIFPSAVTVNLTGSNSTFWSLNNELFETNIATIVPAEFILLNNTGTFNITINVDYFGEYEISESVTTGESKTINVYINQSSWELPCLSMSDCTPKLCTGRFFKELKDCVSNECVYQSFDCGTASRCDTSLGCVDLVSLTNCTIDNHCQNICTDNFTMLNNRCGADGFCKGNNIICRESCNATLGFCQELSGCVLRNEMQFRAGYIRPSDSKFRGGTFQAFCDFSNANKYYCADGFANGFVIKKSDLDFDGATTDDITVTPDGWQAEYINSGNDLKLFAISIFCNEFCNISWEFCKKGCDIDTGRCQGIQKTVDDTLGTASTTNNLIEGWWNWYNAVFPDIHSRSFNWLIGGILLLVIVNALTLVAIPKIAKINVSIKKDYDVIILLVWLFIGSVNRPFAQFYDFAWIVITVIAVVYLVQFVKRKTD